MGRHHQTAGQERDYRNSTARQHVQMTTMGTATISIELAICVPLMVRVMIVHGMTAAGLLRAAGRQADRGAETQR